MTKGICLGFALIVGLVGCAQIGSFTASDASNAAVIDPTNAACYSAIGTVGSLVANATGASGVLSGVATKLALKGALESSGCAAVEAEVLAILLKATPVAPLVP